MKSQLGDTVLWGTYTVEEAILTAETVLSKYQVVCLCVCRCTRALCEGRVPLLSLFVQAFIHSLELG